MIRAVLDANALASGFAGARLPESTPGELIRRWQAGAFELVSSEPLLRELVTTLRQAYFRARLSPARQSRAAALVRYGATQIPLTVPVNGVATHPEDDMVLATAVSANVDYLVTGDERFRRQVPTYQGVRLVSPAEFLAILQEESEARSL
jgi:uncharacterized protein